MSYVRVLPRDLFNESKLLKCLGQIVLLIHDGRIAGLKVHHHRRENGFTIMRDENDGSIAVVNLEFTDSAGRVVHFHHPLNARGAYPLVMMYLNEDYYPLNENGEWQCVADLFLRG